MKFTYWIKTINVIWIYTSKWILTIVWHSLPSLDWYYTRSCSKVPKIVSLILCFFFLYFLHLLFLCHSLPLSVSTIFNVFISPPFGGLLSKQIQSYFDQCSISKSTFKRLLLCFHCSKNNANSSVCFNKLSQTTYFVFLDLKWLISMH